MAIELGDEICAGRHLRYRVHAESARELLQGLLLLRELPRAEAVHELELVLDRAQEHVAGGERTVLGGRQVPPRPQGPQGAQGALLPDVGVLSAEDELQELDRELDVADAAGPELDVAALPGALGGGLDTILHGLYLRHAACLQVATVYELLGHRDEALRELTVPG